MRIRLNRSILPEAAFGGICVWCVVLGGCAKTPGPELTTVSGKVTLDGKPLSNAMVEFTPEKGSPSYGATDAEGQYELRYTRDKRGAMLGRHVVRVTTLRDEDDRKQKAESIPAVYNEESQLTREVKEGANEIDIALTSSGQLVATDTPR